MGGRPIVSEYMAGSGTAGDFYRGSYREPEDFRAKAGDLDRSFDEERRRVGKALIRPAGPKARDLLERASAPGGYFVTTGQQPGLFGGPLYSIYKALTAVRLSEELSDLLGAPVMPLFWIASDDHDWEEANHTWLVDRENALVELTLGEREDQADAAMSRTLLGPAVSPLLEQLESVIPPTDFAARYMALIREAYTPDATVSEAFRTLMMGLLADTPLGFVDAADPALKAAARPVFLRELETAEAAEGVLFDTSGELEGAGYHSQVVLMEGGVNLFLETEAGRHRVYRDDSGYRLGREGASLAQGEVLSRLDDDVGSFSPNVLLRPVVESFLFPTLTYVGGPGEMAYFAQLGDYFAHHDVGAPIVTPRASLVVAEAKIDKVLRKFELEVGDLRDVDRLLTRMARDETPEAVVSALGRWRGSIGELSKELTQAVVAIDPTLKGAVAAARNAGFASLADLQKKVVQAVKRENETTVAQIRKAEVNLWPNGRPQERMLNPLHFLARFGEEFIPAAMAEIRVELGVETR